MIYADYAATTPLDETVLKKMLPYFSGEFGNTSSTHSLGRQASAAVERARAEMAEIAGCKKK